MDIMRFISKIKKANLQQFAITSLITIIIASVVSVTLTLAFGFPKTANSQLYEDPKVLAEKAVQLCNKEVTRFRTCYGEEFKRVVKKYNYQVAVDTLHAAQDLDIKTQDCHLIAHRIADAQVEKDPESWITFIKQVPTNECIGGFIHGTLETHRRFNPEYEISEKTIPEICGLIGKDQALTYCVHMLGHILPVENDGSIDKAAEVCSKLDGKISYNCYTGVFMENITRDNLVAHGFAQHVPYSEESAQAQEEICKQYERDSIQHFWKGEAATGCWQEITHYYVQLSDQNPETLWTKYCSRAKAEKSREACFLHGVSFIAGDPDLDEKINMATLCNPFTQNGTNKERFLKCMNSNIYILTNSSYKFADRVNFLCEKGLSKEMQDKCYGYLGNRLSQLTTTDQKNSYCAKAPKGSVEVCHGT